jgi:3-oxoacyl-[acyl-carrier-protein] synthase-3
MSTLVGNLGLGSFACQFGELERTPETIEGLASICSAQKIGLNLGAMGCGTFWQMTKPLESYVAQCVAQTIAASNVAKDSIDRIIFSTTDQGVRHVDDKFTRGILDQAGLVKCLPAFVSFQQCANSLAALDYGRRLFDDPQIRNVVVVAFDFVPNDSDRIRPWALFGDAVTSFMISKEPASFSLLSYAVEMDFEGLQGRDSFESRKKVATTALQRVLEGSGVRLDEVERIFSTNVYKPIALFSADSCGIPRKRLCIDTLRTRAHCGNCDWMMNLSHHLANEPLVAGKAYLVQSSSPGFYACALLRANSAVG